MSKEIQLSQIFCAENTTVDMVLHFFSDLKECCPNIYPDKMNDCEPVNKPFYADKKILQPYVEQETDLFFVNRKAKVEFTISMKQSDELANRHTSFEFRLQKTKIRIEEEHKTLLKKVSGRFDTEFAHIHIPIFGERPFGIENGTMGRDNYFLFIPICYKNISLICTLVLFLEGGMLRILEWKNFCLCLHLLLKKYLILRSIFNWLRIR